MIIIRLSRTSTACIILTTSIYYIEHFARRRSSTIFLISLVGQSVLEDIMAAWGWAGELTGNRTLICLTYKLKPEPCGGYATQEQIPPNKHLLMPSRLHTELIDPVRQTCLPSLVDSESNGSCDRLTNCHIRGVHWSYRR